MSVAIQHALDADQFPALVAEDNVSIISNDDQQLAQLELFLRLELKFRGSAQPGHSDHATITSGMRDGSAHVLRCLKVWYDLPSEVFFAAVSSIDRFLAKMKAQPKHLSCIAVSAFHLACRQYQPDHAPDPSDLVNISQSRCTPSDLLRMQAILAAKLELGSSGGEVDCNQAAPSTPVTSLTFLRLMYDICRNAAVKMGMQDLLLEPNLPDHLIHQLEILSCDSLTLGHRPCEVSLALLATHFQLRSAALAADAAASAAQALMGFVTELQRVCGVSNGAFVRCLGIVVGQLDRYNGEGTVAHRQRLVWKLSNRTLRHLRPTDKLRPMLPTINEKAQAAGSLQRRRSNSECSEESMASLSESDDSEREQEEEMLTEEENGY
jgi:cyclin G2